MVENIIDDCYGGLHGVSVVYVCEWWREGRRKG